MTDRHVVDEREAEVAGQAAEPGVVPEADERPPWARWKGAIPQVSSRLDFLVGVLAIDSSGEYWHGSVGPGESSYLLPRDGPAKRASFSGADFDLKLWFLPAIRQKYPFTHPPRSADWSWRPRRSAYWCTIDFFRPKQCLETEMGL